MAKRRGGASRRWCLKECLCPLNKGINESLGDLLKDRADKFFKDAV